MMTIDAFFDKYNGKYVDYDGKYGYQCVDLMRQYCVEVLGINGYTLPSVTYAKQLFTNFKNNKSFTRVFNGKYNSPKKGDIIVWGFYWGVTGWAGHVAVCSSSNSMNFISFDQNYGKPNFCKFTNHNYKGVLGWLSPR